MIIIICNILQSIYLLMLSHFIDCVTFFLQQLFKIDIFNQLLAMMPPYPGFTWFTMPYCQPTQWSGKQMIPLGCMLATVFAVTCLIPSASQRILFTEALLCIQNIVYFHHMAQNKYHTEGMIEYMQKYPEEYYRHKDVFGWFGTSQFTKPVSEVLEQQLTLDQHKEQKSDPTWSELSAAAMRDCVHED